MTDSNINLYKDFDPAKTLEVYVPETLKESTEHPTLELARKDFLDKIIAATKVSEGDVLLKNSIEQYNKNLQDGDFTQVDRLFERGNPFANTKRNAIVLPPGWIMHSKPRADKGEDKKKGDKLGDNLFYGPKWKDWAFRANEGQKWILIKRKTVKDAWFVYLDFDKQAQPRGVSRNKKEAGGGGASMEDTTPIVNTVNIKNVEIDFDKHIQASILRANKQFRDILSLHTTFELKKSNSTPENETFDDEVKTIMHIVKLWDS
jgi:hypothetical protein